MVDSSIILRVSPPSTKPPKANWFFVKLEIISVCSDKIVYHVGVFAHAFNETLHISR